MKTTIKFATPLLLTLAFGCNDTQPIDEVGGEAFETENQRADGEPIANNRTETTKRAGALIKTQRILELITQANVVNPYAAQGESEQALPYCDVSSSPQVEATDSACGGFGEYHQVVQVSNCDFGNGDVLDATLYVSNPFINDLESAHQALLDPAYRELVVHNKEWSVDISIQTDSGNEIQACGSVDNGIFRQSADFIVTMPGGEEGGEAQYEIQTTKRTRSLQAQVSRSAVHLITSNSPMAEIHAMDIFGVSTNETGLLPEKGIARIHNVGGHHVSFSPNLSAEGSVYQGAFFRHQSVVDIPAL